MWQCISNISSIVTCFLFLLYLIGHIWKIIDSRNTIYEAFNIYPYDSSIGIEDTEHFIGIDEIGDEFSISSSYGIRNIKIYRIQYDEDHITSRELKASYKDLNINNTLYVRCSLGECIPISQIEIERMDYTKVTFEPYSSGKNGNIITENYKFKMSFRSFIYHLCM